MLHIRPLTWVTSLFLFIPSVIITLRVLEAQKERSEKKKDSAQNNKDRHTIFNMNGIADPIDRIVAGNREFAQRTAEKNPNAFEEQTKGQWPEVLWIGCADSRVPETTICRCQPGDIFVHRNIANCVHTNDISAASVVEYAVTHLKVRKVVVCGHTKCGGANAALSDADLGTTLNTWLHPVRELRRKHKAELEKLPDDDARVSRVAELNVQSSLDVLEQHPAVKSAIASRGLTLHGMIYDLGAGQLRLLESSEGKANNGLWSPIS